MDAINGDSNERVVCAKQMMEAAVEIERLLKLNAAMQHVVNMASLFNNPDDDAGDDDDHETMIELYFAVQDYRAALGVTISETDSQPPDRREPE